jgi:peptidoglycan/LPS O-acetylase OafA/YrhL
VREIERARRVELELHYRKDIDGLRAIAVLLVVLFHVHPHRFTGGFIGVDVFFVISGFLITGLISSGLRDGSFSLVEFYARRIRRIFPALAVVLAASMVAGWLVLFPADYLNLGKHVAASAAFVANFTLLQDTGYFDTPSALKPVLHLWSLGIEEQFYLVWPTLMLLAWRRRGAPLALAGAILAASFAWHVLLGRSDPAAAFFLPTTRFWELMVGCILALALPVTGAPAPATRDAASLLGGGLIAVGTILIGGGRSYTAWWALVPVLGAALLIAAGPGALVNRQLLSRTPLVWLGLISYPLYLWHWPILAFMRHYDLKAPSDLMRWGGIALAIALATATYRWVENPIRRGAPIAFKSIGAAAAMLAIGLAGAAVFAAGGYAARFPGDVAILFKENDNVAKTFVGSGLCLREARREEFAFTDDCRRRSADESAVVVWGDSHASNLVRGLAEIERTRPSLRLMFFATIGCPPIPSYAFTYPGLPDCPAANRVAVEKIGSMKPDTIILAANWAIYDGGPNAALVDQDSIREVVDRLKAIGVRRIVGVGQFPVWHYAVPKLIAREYRDGRASPAAAATSPPMRSSNNLEARTFAADQNARRWFLSAGATFMSPLATLCNDAGCLLTVPGRADPMDRDEDHMTNAGSVWFTASNAKSLLGE